MMIYNSFYMVDSASAQEVPRTHPSDEATSTYWPTSFSVGSRLHCLYIQTLFHLWWTPVPNQLLVVGMWFNKHTKTLPLFQHNNDPDEPLPNYHNMACLGPIATTGKITG